MHGRADVVFNSGKFWVGRGAGPATQRLLCLDDLHFESSAGTYDGGGQAVGSAADDGDVHRSITVQTPAYSLVG
ncbi:hypothetical protein MSIM_08270 [Mycobacterium simiae]|nr:hypothetical protein MSIM_08270 [Mycobacterium simiae]